MADGARDATFNLDANDRTQPGVSSASRRLKGLEDQSKRTSKAVSDNLGTVGSIFGKQVETALTGVARAGGPILAGAAISAAPLIGATLSAAVLGAAGGGGIIGGVVLASRDARVQAAGKTLGDRLLSGLEADAAPIIKPLLDAMGQVYARADDLDRILSRAFSGVADDIGPLVESLLDGAEAFGEGFADAVEGAGPVLAALGDGVEGILTAAGEGMSLLADNGVEAAQAVSDIAGAIITTTEVTFELIDALTQVYGYARAYAELQTGNVSGAVALVAAMELQTNATRSLGDGLSFTAVEAEDAAAAIQQLNDEVFRAAGLNISAAEAQLRYTEAVKTARDSVDGLSKVSAEEEGNLLRQATASNTVVQALIDQSASTETVAAATVRARSEFIGTATAMGVTRARAEELANSYLAIPTLVRTRAVADTNSATAEIERLKARLGDIPSQINVAIRVTGSDASRAAIAAALGKQNFAASEAGMFRESAAHAERTFMAAAGFQAGGESASRVGGPAPLSVENTVNVALDGAPFYDMTVSAVSSGLSRTSFWQKVGKR